MTKRHKDEGTAPRVKNPSAQALGKLGFAAQFAGMTPEEKSAEQARRVRCRWDTWAERRAAFIKAEADALAEEVARQHRQADKEGLPRERTARSPDAS